MSKRQAPPGKGKHRRIELGDGWYTFESCKDFAIFSGEPAAGAVGALQEAMVESLVADGRSAASDSVPSAVKIARVSQSVRTSDDG